MCFFWGGGGDSRGMARDRIEGLGRSRMLGVYTADTYYSHSWVGCWAVFWEPQLPVAAAPIGIYKAM
jgi:hypothetical protein